MTWEDVERTEWLITGGTGSLGKTLIGILLNVPNIKGIRIYSRDEFKQWQLKQKIQELQKNHGLSVNISFLIGDVRDKQRLSRAMNGVDYVINAAAMKQVPACEDDPLEAIKTNINGAVNVIDCAIDNRVKKVLHISTDKAVYPINLYGATKMAAEKLFINSNVYAPGRTRFSCCRYGNVLGSRGSIIQVIEKCIDEKKAIPLTHPEMTRFFVTLEKMAEFIIESLFSMEGGEIFIPKMSSMKITDIISSVAGEDATTDVIGIRDGEKIHETIISYEESEFLKEFDDYYIIDKYLKNKKKEYEMKSIDSYSNQDFLTGKEVDKFLEESKIV